MRYGRVLLLVLIAGCGLDAPRPDSSAGAPPPRDLVQIVLSPITSSVQPGMTITYVVSAYYSDGWQQPGIPVTWTSSNETVATIDAGVATIHDTGSSTITATAQADPSLSSAATITSAWPPVAPPAQFYAHDDSDGFVGYDASGNRWTVLPYNTSQITGMVVRQGVIYFIDGSALRTLNLSTNALQTFATFPQTAQPQGLAFDPSRNLLFAGDAQGSIFRIDGGTVTVQGTTPDEIVAMDIGPNGEVYALGRSSTGPHGVWRQATDGAVFVRCLNYMPRAGFPRGFAIAPNGTIYIADNVNVSSGVDTNGDGIITFSELTVIATVWSVWGLELANGVIYINDWSQGRVHRVVNGATQVFSMTRVDCTTDAQCFRAAN